MPKKGNSLYSDSNFKAPKPSPRPKIFKPNRLKLFEILKGDAKGKGPGSSGDVKSLTYSIHRPERDTDKYRDLRKEIESRKAPPSHLWLRNYYRYQKGEIFKRMKATTFVQLIIQVAEYDSQPSEDNDYRPDTADLEIEKIQRGEGDRSPAPSLALTEGDFGAPPTRPGGHSTLQGVIKGVGELDPGRPVHQEVRSRMDPYLLLDVRDKDSFDECHIISALNYPKAMLSRSVNYQSKEMLDYKNQEGKIIILYDEDEKIAPEAATTLVERGYDNIFLLSGGMKVSYKIFSSALFTGTPPPIVTGMINPNAEIIKASKAYFDQTDLDNLSIYLDSALEDRSTGSRLSKATTASSRMSNYSKTERKIQSSLESGRITGRAAFKP